MQVVAAYCVHVTARSDNHTAGIDRSVVAGYAAGSVGTGGFGVLPGLVLAYYLTDTLGVAAAIASLVVIIPKIADVVLDPWIGAVSDRMMRRSGSRVRMMLTGAVLMPALFIATFATPTAFGPAAGAVWVLVFFLLSAVTYSLFQVPYIALPAELTDGYDERTRLISVRIAVLAATILLVGAGGPAIRDGLGGGAPGYIVMAVVVSALICAGMLAATMLAARRATPPRSTTESVSAWTAYRDGLDALREVRRFRILVLVFVIQALATAIMLAGAQYVATYVLDNEGALTGLFAALVAPALLVMPLWYRYGKSHGKVGGLVFSSSLFGCATVLLILMVWIPGWWIYMAVGLAGIGYAGMQAFPLAMLPDVIDEDADRGGRERGGALAGVWTATETAGLALGPAVFLGLLAVSGFVSSTDDEVVAQPESAVTAIALAFSLLPAVLVGVSLLLLRGYDDRPTKESIDD